MWCSLLQKECSWGKRSEFLIGSEPECVHFNDRLPACSGISFLYLKLLVQ
uniref:Uncharacterized protein n=1 Tax=Anguilla anguilla TaxID=7936 RepID=A0A0E9REZ2_ANGAN